MLPYGYYADQFVNAIYRHDFDWKLYKVKLPGKSFSSAPNLCFQYGVYCGQLSHPETQQTFPFDVAYKAYQEAGLILDNLLRIKYYDLYYLTMNTGYFYHFGPTAYNKNDGVLSIGLGIEF